MCYNKFVMNTTSRIRLSGDNLKFIAVILMTIDHIAFGLLHYFLSVRYMDILPQTYTKLNNIYEFGKGLGRIAFPIFCFFLVEGFIKSKNLTKYAIRLLLFAIISEVPFDLGLYQKFYYPDHQNVMLTLLLGLLMMMTIQRINEKIVGLSTQVKYLCIICAVTVYGQVANILHTDYSYRGIILIALIYMLRNDKTLQLLAGAALTSLQKCAPIAFLLLLFYDDSQKPKYKYFFYIFYPLHLAIIYLFSFLI